MIWWGWLVAAFACGLILGAVLVLVAGLDTILKIQDARAEGRGP